MTDEWDEFESEDDETVFAQGRLPNRTYVSKSFAINRPNSSDFGAPARFFCKVFDPESESMLEREADEWVLRETPAGRYQIKLLVAREPGNVKGALDTSSSGTGQIRRSKRALRISTGCDGGE